MAELLEYSLVVLVSTLFVSGSVATYNSFASFESHVQFGAEVSAVSNMVSVAIRNGTSRAELSLPGSTILCDSGNLTVASGSMTAALAVPLACHFSATLGPGLHVVTFTRLGTALALAVT